MKEYWRALVNFLLYGHFWIAAAALAMCWQTEWLLTGHLSFGWLPVVVTSGTLSLYALHRLVGLRSVAPFRHRGRFRVIARFRWHILLYLVVFGTVAAIGFFLLPSYLQWALATPCLLALAYVLPLFGAGRRLRDLHYLKIFLVAIAWAWITAAVPARAAGLLGTFPAWLLIAERSCFIFAITLPFDLRDREIDRFTGVQTLPRLLGPLRTKRLAAGVLLLTAAWAGLNAHLGTYSWPVLSGLWLALAVAGGLVWRARGTESDYYYTGWIDGTMILQFVLILFAEWLI
jgi:4-hydroxybenzoate polyprenyltransferase